MSFITYPQKNGRVAVVSPNSELLISEVIAGSIPSNTPYKVVESLDIDDNYFDAYEFNSETGAEVNIEKAKAIHIDKFRFLRSPLLAKLDVAYMRALEIEDSVAASAIAVQKQELRDVTKITLPNTLPEIKATWPDILN
jgi:hypothetical protein